MKEVLVLEDFHCSGGKHCQTTAMKGVLDYGGIHLSEEMLLGLGGGIGFIYWHMKGMPAPFVGGRNAKPEDFVLNICGRIGIEAEILQTSSKTRGYEELKSILRDGKPAYIFVDMVYFPYLALPENAHFGAHTVAVFGLDEINDKVYIADRGKRPVNVTTGELEEARNSKFPPFQPKNKLLKIRYPLQGIPLEEGIISGIRESCDAMHDPPIKNFGLAGMKKWAGMVTKWPEQFKGENLLGCLFNTFVYIEIGGTGGSAFRPMYARFLRECREILGKPALEEVADLFIKSGESWSGIARASLPDSWDSLKRIRELMVENNKVFEEQGPDALEIMVKIRAELHDAMDSATRELAGKNERVTELLKNLRDEILECRDKEQAAFSALRQLLPCGGR